MKQVMEELNALEKGKFWGEITIRFKDGFPALIIKHEQIKINNQKVKSRKNHHSFHDSEGNDHEAEYKPTA